MQRISEDTSGVFVIAATPFDQAGAVDWASVDSLVDFYLAEGVHGMTVLGVMGEAPKLDDAERIELVRRVLGRVAGRVPVLVGVSESGLGRLAWLAEESMAAGAAGVMVAGNRGQETDEQVHGWFARVLERLGPEVPVCLQDYPPTTGVHVSVDVVNRLVDERPNLVMFKHEDCPGLRKLSRLRGAEEQGRRRVGILVGNGGLYVPQEIARGADGIMTGFAFPGMLVEVWRRCAEGDVDGAEDLFDLYLPLIRHEQQIGFGLAVRKEVLRRRGAIACPAAREPGPSLDAVDRAELERLLARLCAKLEAAGRQRPRGL
jgi:4-hydroxy-tetrahydrodipicolinate synthase